MEKEVRKIEVDVLREFLETYVPEAKIILYDHGIEIEHEGYAWLLSGEKSQEVK